MKDRDWWIETFTERGLRYLPDLSQALRDAAYPERAYDLGTNLVAFGRPGVSDSDAKPLIAGTDCQLFPSGFCDEATRYLGFHAPESDAVRRERRRRWVEGQVMALWPELDLAHRQVTQVKRDPGRC